MHKLVALACLALQVSLAHAQGSLPVELEDCTGPGATFCFDTAPLTIENACGALFENYQGRVGWPALRNAGPITVSVQTRNTGFDGQTWYPLYVEVAPRIPTDTGCATERPGYLVLSTNSGFACGGSWASVGPIDLTTYHIPLGGAYSVQCVFFRTTPTGVTHRTVGFSCIRVSSTQSAATGAEWSSVKTLYK